MDVTKQYAIAWKGLKNGTYRFDFKVDNALFEAYGSTDIKDGDLSVGVTLERGGVDALVANRHPRYGDRRLRPLPGRLPPARRF